MLSVEVLLLLQEEQWWVGEVGEVGEFGEESVMIGTVVHLLTHSQCYQEPSLTVVKAKTFLIIQCDNMRS